jgi:hypothetical protein
MNTNNHLALMFGYIDRLTFLAQRQNWLDLTRADHPDNEKLQELFDRQQRIIVAEKIKISDEMFEIARSN